MATGNLKAGELQYYWREYRAAAKSALHTVFGDYISHGREAASQAGTLRSPSPLPALPHPSPSRPSFFPPGLPLTVLPLRTVCGVTIDAVTVAAGWAVGLLSLIG